MGSRIHWDLYHHRPWAGQFARMVVCRAAGHRNRGARPRRGQTAAQAPLILGAVCLALAALAGLLSIGLLLVPGVVAATVAATRPSWRPHTDDAAS